jgi:hypothetical protein
MMGSFTERKTQEAAQREAVYEAALAAKPGFVPLGPRSPSSPDRWFTPASPDVALRMAAAIREYEDLYGPIPAPQM